MKVGNVGLKVKIMACNLIPTIMLIALSAMVWFAVNHLLESFEWVDTTYETVVKGRRIRQRVADMESAVRGFLLTGDESNIKLYNDSQGQFQEFFTDAKKRVRDNPASLKYLQQAEDVITQWQANVAQPEISLRKEIGSGKDVRDLARLTAEGKDKESFDRLRQAVRKFISLEQAHLADVAKAQGEEAAKGSAEINLILLRDIIKQVDHATSDIMRGQEIAILADDMQRAMRGFLLSGKEEFLEPYQAAQKNIFQKMDQLRDLQIQTGQTDRAELFDQMRATLKEWTETAGEPQIELRRQINKSKTMADLSEFVATVQGKKYTDEFRQLMRAFEKEELRQLGERKADSERTAVLTDRVITAGTMVVVFLSLIAAYLVAGAMTKPLANAVNFAAAVTQGDLTGQLEVKTRDEVGTLGEALNLMVRSLRGQTRRILEGVNVLASAAAETSATISQVASGTNQTSTAVSETSTTVEEVKQAATTSKERAMSVAQSSQRAVEISVEGRRATEDTLNRMNLIKEQMESIGETVVKLSDHSQAIEEIISTVQDLADQSNLLAVNASIEAARAGDQGKGFSVVAQEIKTLADQSREATDQVRGILEDTRKWVSAVVMATEQGGKAVDAGVRQSLTAGEAIQALANSVAEAAQVAGVIQVSSDQQVQGVEQVASAMLSINSAVQQNVSGTSQLEDMAKKINEVGGSLKEMVEHYRV